MIRTEDNKNYVVDCGSSSLTAVGKKELIPYLKYHGMGRLDGIAITDFKKSRVSGIIELLEEREIQIDKIFIPNTFRGEEGKQEVTTIYSYAKERGITIEYLIDGVKQLSGSYQYGFSWNPHRQERKFLIKKRNQYLKRE